MEHIIKARKALFMGKPYWYYEHMLLSLWSNNMPTIPRGL